VLFAALWLTATTRLIKPTEDGRTTHEAASGRPRRMLSMRRRETAATTR
jgi:hypothetical protein